jgi:cell division protease FtsH
MSNLGPLMLGDDQTQPFLGRDLGHVRDYSDNKAAQIDDEIYRFVEEAREEARDILTKYRDKLDLMVERLLEKETLEKEEVAAILAEVAKQFPHDPIERARLRRRARDETPEPAEPEKPRRRPTRAPKPSLGEA